MSRKKATTTVLFTPEKAMEVVARDFGVPLEDLEVTDTIGTAEQILTIEWERDKRCSVNVYTSRKVAEDGCTDCIKNYIEDGKIENEVNMDSQEMILALLEICDQSGIQQWIEVEYRAAAWNREDESEGEREPLGPLSIYKENPMLALLSFAKENERYGILMAQGRPDPLKVPTAVLKGLGGVEGFTDIPTIDTPEGFHIEPENDAAQELMDAMLEGKNGG